MTTAVPSALDDAFRRIAAAAGGSPDERRHLTRQSLAARHFVDAVGDRIRFDHARAEWFLWRDHRWHRDQDGGIRRLWLDVLADRYRDALLIEREDARDEALAAIRAAGATDNAIASGLRIAASFEPVALTGAEWDTDPWLLGCENGVLDLRTGVRRDGRPEDLVSRSTHLAHDAAAECPRWLRFLDEVFAGDEELAAWFQRLMGASLVGVSKEIVVIHHGHGNNGKSVAAVTLRSVAGDYGVEVPIETLLAGRREAGAPTSDLMRLRGARLAFTSEPDQAARLKGGTLKRLATIDQMKGRELHGRQQEWEPTHTIHLAVNRLPEVDDTSNGTWRRIAVVPWRVTFLKPGQGGQGRREDPRLAEELRSEAAGILAWLVRGAVVYASTRTLRPFPSAVEAETAVYRAEEDPLREFVEGWLAEGDEDQIATAGDLHAAYLAWAEGAQLPNTERLSAKRFGRAFAERHDRLGWRVRRGTRNGRTIYRGILIVSGDRPAGGFGGFGGTSAGVRYAGGESGDTGKWPEKATKATDSGGRAPGGSWDEDLAERATDDDAEAAR